jgi:hypothetical protein
MRMLCAVPIALSLAALAPTVGRAAVEIPFLEDFPNNNRGWENNANAPLTHVDAGGPDGSSYVSTEFNYFGFTSPFGGGPVIFRATGDDNPSGNGFKGDWIEAGVGELRFWVRHDTGVDLTYFVRFATNFNFPGVVFDDDAVVPSGVWTQIVMAIDADDPDCQLEGVDTCAEVLEAVGNFQIGTTAPAPLPATNEAFTMDLDQIELDEAPVPEPGQAILALVGALAMAGARKLHRKDGVVTPVP